MIKNKIFTGIVGGSLIFSGGGLFALPNANTIHEQARGQVNMRVYDKLQRIDGEIVIKRFGESSFKRVKLAKGVSVESAIAKYRLRGDIEYAEPNYVAHALSVPNDPYYVYQWNLRPPTGAAPGGINAEDAWDITRGAGVVVAVVDTGVAYEDNGFWYKRAPDLADTSFVNGYDFVNNDSHPNDDNGHGTHVAGTVAGSTNNNTGVAGIAYEASIMPVKVLDSNGSGSYADVADGIRFAADNGANIINLSLGGPYSATYLMDAVKYAYDKGVTVIAAAGNDGSNSPIYPAAYDDYVIAVGATRYDAALAPYSNYGASVDVVAPGGDLNVDQNGDGYGDGILQQTFGGSPRWFGYYFYQGTSMATPHVAGVAALIIANGNASAPAGVQDALQSTATDLGAAGRDDRYGWGLVNAAAALGYAAGPVDNPPSVAVTNPADGAVVSGSVTVSASASDDNAVSMVEFYVDGALAASDYASPYQYQWDSLSVGDGSHGISAKAFDDAGQSSSDAISVFVDNINDPPVADAGGDISVTDADGNGSEAVALDGSGSYDPDGFISSYVWKEGTATLGSAVSINADLPVGVHSITLMVTDNGGATSTDAVSVTVNPKPLVPPGPKTLFSDGFENGEWNNLWVETNGSKWIIKRPEEKEVPGSRAGNKVAHVERCRTKGGCVLELADSVDASGFASLTLQFDRFVDRSLDRREYLEVQVFDGTGWRRVAYWTNRKGDDDKWHHETIDVSGFISSDFRVRFLSKESSSAEDVEVDNVEITAE